MSQDLAPELEPEGFKPLTPLFEDIYVSEILINGHENIFFEKQGTLHRHNSSFSNPLALQRFVRHLLAQLDKTADRRYPLVDGTLTDGTRVHIALPPVTDEPCISLRRHLINHWNFEELHRQGMVTGEQFEKLTKWVLERKNILICGSTGSGKTTLLRSLLQIVSQEERLLILEDTSEINLNSPRSVSLLTREDPQGLVPSIDLSLLLKNALRMRPDRLIIGEVRGIEALILLDALATGHRGSMSSIHASSPLQALFRLEGLVSRAAPQWSIRAIRQLIGEAIQAVVCVEKQNGLRRVSQTVEITGVESFGYLLG